MKKELPPRLKYKDGLPSLFVVILMFPFLILLNLVEWIENKFSKKDEGRYH